MSFDSTIKINSLPIQSIAICDVPTPITLLPIIPPKSIEEARQQAFASKILLDSGRLNPEHSEEACDAPIVSFDSLPKKELLLENVKGRLTQSFSIGNTEYTIAKTVAHQKQEALKHNNKVVHLKLIGSDAMKCLGMENIRSILGPYISQLISPDIEANYNMPAMDSDTQVELDHSDANDLANASLTLAHYFGALPKDDTTSKPQKLKKAFSEIDVVYTETWGAHYSNTLRTGKKDHSTGKSIPGHFVYSLFYLEVEGDSIDEACNNLKVRIVCPNNHFRESILHYLFGIMACNEPEKMNYLVSYTYLSGLIRNKVCYDPKLFPTLLRATFRQFFNFESKSLKIDKFTDSFRNTTAPHHQISSLALLLAANRFKELSQYIEDKHWKKFLTQDFFKTFWERLLTENEIAALDYLHPSLRIDQQIDVIDALLEMGSFSTKVLFSEKLMLALIEISQNSEKEHQEKALKLWDKLFQLKAFTTHWDDNLAQIISPKMTYQMHKAGLFKLPHCNPFNSLIPLFNSNTTNLSSIRVKKILEFPLEFYDYDWSQLSQSELIWNHLVKATLITSLRHEYFLECLAFMLKGNRLNTAFKLAFILVAQPLNKSENTLFEDLAYRLCEAVLNKMLNGESSYSEACFKLVKASSKDAPSLCKKLCSLLSNFVQGQVKDLNPLVPHSPYLKSLYPLFSEVLFLSLEYFSPPNAKEHVVQMNYLNKIFQCFLKPPQPNYAQGLDFYEKLSIHSLFKENLFSWPLEKNRTLEAFNLALQNNYSNSVYILLKLLLTHQIPIVSYNKILIKLVDSWPEAKSKEVLLHPQSCLVLGKKMWHRCAKAWLEKHHTNVAHAEGTAQITKAMLKLYLEFPGEMAILKNPETLLALARGISLLTKQKIFIEIRLSSLIHFLLYLSPKKAPHTSAISNIIYYISRGNPSHSYDSDFALLKNILQRAKSSHVAYDPNILFYHYAKNNISAFLNAVGNEDISLLLPGFATLWQQNKKKEAFQWIQSIHDHSLASGFIPSKKNIQTYFNIISVLLDNKAFTLAQLLMGYLKEYVQGPQKVTLEELSSLHIEVSLQEGNIQPFLERNESDKNFYKNEPELFSSCIRKSLRLIPPHQALALIQKTGIKLDLNEWRDLWHEISRKTNESLLKTAFELWTTEFPTPQTDPIFAETCFFILCPANASIVPFAFEYFSKHLECLKNNIELLKQKKDLYNIIEVYLKLRFKTHTVQIEPILEWLRRTLSLSFSDTFALIYVLLYESISSKQASFVHKLVLVLINLSKEIEAASKETKNQYGDLYKSHLISNYSKFLKSIGTQDIDNYENDFLILLNFASKASKFPLDDCFDIYCWLTTKPQSQHANSLSLRRSLALTFLEKAIKAGTPYSSEYFFKVRSSTHELLLHLSSMPKLFFSYVDLLELAYKSNLIHENDFCIWYANAMVCYLEDIRNNPKIDKEARAKGLEFFLTKHILYCSTKDNNEVTEANAKKAALAATRLLLTMLSNQEYPYRFLIYSERLFRMLFSPLDYKKVENNFVRLTAKKLSESDVPDKAEVPYLQDTSSDYSYYADCRSLFIDEVANLCKEVTSTITTQKVILYTLSRYLEGYISLVASNKLTEFDSQRIFFLFDAFFCFNTLGRQQIIQEHTIFCKILISCSIDYLPFLELSNRMSMYALLVDCQTTYFPKLAFQIKLGHLESLAELAFTKYPHITPKLISLLDQEFKLVNTGQPQRLLAFLKNLVVITSELENVKYIYSLLNFQQHFLFKNSILFGSQLDDEFKKEIGSIYKNYIQHSTKYMVKYSCHEEFFWEHHNNLYCLVSNLIESNIFISENTTIQTSLFDIFIHIVQFYYKNTYQLSSLIKKSQLMSSTSKAFLYTALERLISNFKHVSYLSKTQFISWIGLFENQNDEDSFSFILEKAFKPSIGLFTDPADIVKHFNKKKYNLIARSYSKALGHQQAIAQYIDILTKQLDNPSDNFWNFLYVQSCFFSSLLSLQLPIKHEVKPILIRLVACFTENGEHEKAMQLCMRFIKEPIVYREANLNKTYSTLCLQGFSKHIPSQNTLKLFKLCCEKDIFTPQNAYETLKKGFRFLANSSEESDLNGYLQQYLIKLWDSKQFEESLWACQLIDQLDTHSQKNILEIGFQKAKQYSHLDFMRSAILKMSENHISLFEICFPDFLTQLTLKYTCHQDMIRKILIDLYQEDFSNDLRLQRYFFNREIQLKLHTLYLSLPPNDRPPILKALQIVKIRTEVLHLSNSPKPIPLEIISNTFQEIDNFFSTPAFAMIQDMNAICPYYVELLDHLLNGNQDNEKAETAICQWFFDNATPLLFISSSQNIQNIVLKHIRAHYSTTPIQNFESKIKRIFNPCASPLEFCSQLFYIIKLIIQYSSQYSPKIYTENWMAFFARQVLNIKKEFLPPFCLEVLHNSIDSLNQNESFALSLEIIGILNEHELLTKHIVEKTWNALYATQNAHFCSKLAIQYPLYIPQQQELIHICKLLLSPPENYLIAVLGIVKQFKITDESIWNLIIEALSLTNDHKTIQTTFVILKAFSLLEDFRSKKTLFTTCWFKIFETALKHEVKIDIIIFKSYEDFYSLFSCFQHFESAMLFASMAYRYLIDLENQPLEIVLRIRGHIPYAPFIDEYDVKALHIALKQDPTELFDPLLNIFISQLDSYYFSLDYCKNIAKLCSHYRDNGLTSGVVPLPTIFTLNRLCSQLLNKQLIAKDLLILANSISELPFTEFASCALKLIKHVLLTNKRVLEGEEITLFNQAFTAIMKYTLDTAEVQNVIFLKEFEKALPNHDYFTFVVESVRIQLLESLTQENLSSNFKKKFEACISRIKNVKKCTESFFAIEMFIEVVCNAFVITENAEQCKKYFNIIEKNFPFKTNSKKVTQEITEAQTLKMFKVNSITMKISSHMIRTFISLAKLNPSKRDILLKWTFEATEKLLHDFPLDDDFLSCIVLELITNTAPQNQKELDQLYNSFLTHIKKDTLKRFWEKQPLVSYLWYTYMRLTCPKDLIIKKEYKLYWMHSILDTLQDSPSWWNIQHFIATVSQIEQNTKNITESEYCAFLIKIFSAVSKLPFTTLENFNLVIKIANQAPDYCYDVEVSATILQQLCEIYQHACESKEFFSNILNITHFQNQLNTFLGSEKFIKLWKLHEKQYYTFIEKILPFQFKLLEQHPHEYAKTFFLNFTKILDGSNLWAECPKDLQQKRDAIVRKFFSTFSRHGLIGQYYALQLAGTDAYKIYIRDKQIL